MQIQRHIIFISHCLEDSDIALWLARKLKESGLEIWLDHNNIKPGQSIVDSVNSAIESCNVFILLWSDNAQKSQWVNFEWTSAITINKTIVPIILDDTPLPTLLRRILYIEFLEKESGYEKLYDCLVSVNA